MKILPSNLDDFNDIEKIGDEFYFKKDEDLKTVEPVEVSPETPIESDLHMLKVHKERHPGRGMEVASTVPSKIATKAVVRGDNEIDSDIEGTAEVDDILRDVRSTSGYDVIMKKLVTAHSSPTQPTELTSVDVDKSLWEDELRRINANILAELETPGGTDAATVDSNSVTLSILNATTKATPIESEKFQVSVDNEIFVETGDDLVVATKQTSMPVIKYDRSNVLKGTDEDSDEDDYSYEDYSVEVDGRKTRRRNRIRTHTSYQKTAIRQPLLQQGFIATPGYPKYYIGDSNCSWRITVPMGQRIRLTILDINLRCE